MRKAGVVLFAVLLSAMQANAYHFKLNGIYYNFIEGTADEVEVTYPIEYRHDDYDGEGDYYNSIVIPQTVSYKNKEYRVTSIGEQAFRESGVEAITIPKSITYIGPSAFNSCGGLKKVEVQWEKPLDLNEVEKRYLELGYDPPSIAEHIFDFGMQYFENATLIVPKNTKALYQEQYVWKSFSCIKEKEEESDEPAPNS